MNRKQMAIRIIDSVADELVFDIDCGNTNLSEKSEEELVEIVYKRLLYGTRAKHFKFLTAEWIKETTAKYLEKAARKWGVAIA